ncbi:MAG: acyl-CoA/acyl-ACP dehydrogenase [Pirellulaceae bacterium]|nr:acyl-CoA/acyl-ACP dehydrogenase [Pirellulaceae bacterium]
MSQATQERPPVKSKSQDDKAGSDAISLILAQAGRTAEEIASLATLDDADRAAEQQFSGEAPTLTTLFGNLRATELDAGSFSPAPDVAEAMAACLEFVVQRKKDGTLLDHQKMLFHDDTLAGLAQRGFFGLAIPKEYAGSGAKLGDLGPLLRALTLVHPDLAVMFEVHNFLGPVTPLLDFGTEEQKQYYLPRMARGELLGSFALTEPGVGADPSRLSLTARRDGDRYLVSGVKWPITNVVYGGLCVLILKIEGDGLPKGRDSAMLLFETPKADNENFRMIRNRLCAFDYLWNARFRLTDCPVPAKNLLGPAGRGLAQAFSSLAKGRGGICVNSAAKIFRLLAQLIQDPEVIEKKSENTLRNGHGGWTSFRSTFGKPIGNAPRIQTWMGRAICHALASRVLGDVCFRLAANNVRDESMGMIAKVFASKALLETAIHAYQIQGGRAVHLDERRYNVRRSGEAAGQDENLIENYIGENMHEFAIATVYEGPNPVLADVGAPNAMTRDVRTKYLEPIGLAEAKGGLGLIAKAKFGLFIAKTVIGSFNPRVGSLDGVRHMTPLKERLIRRGLRRNRALGRKILLIIARYQKNFMDQSFLLGDEGGVFDQLSVSTAAMCYAIALDKTQPEYAQVAEALDMEATLMSKSRAPSPDLYRLWAEIGQKVMDPSSVLYRDLIADVQVSRIPLDPRHVSRYI